MPGQHRRRAAIAVDFACVPKFHHLQGQLIELVEGVVHPLDLHAGIFGQFLDHRRAGIRHIDGELAVYKGCATVIVHIGFVVTAVRLL